MIVGWSPSGFPFIAVFSSKICAQSSWAGGISANATRRSFSSWGRRESLPPLSWKSLRAKIYGLVKFALDELIYVLQGRGVSTVWTADGAPKRTFEWQDRSLFQIGSNCSLQLGNMRGDRPVRLLRYSYLPLATSLITEPSFYFNNPFQKLC